MTPRPILAAVIFAALTPAVALGTVGVAFVLWIGDVSRAKAAANARARVYCTALHFDDETCPRCCPEADDLPFNVTDLTPHLIERDEALAALALGALTDRLDVVPIAVNTRRGTSGANLQNGDTCRQGLHPWPESAKPLSGKRRLALTCGPCEAESRSRRHQRRRIRRLEARAEVTP